MSDYGVRRVKAQRCLRMKPECASSPISVDEMLQKEAIISARYLLLRQMHIKLEVESMESFKERFNIKG